MAVWYVICASPLIVMLIGDEVEVRHSRGRCREGGTVPGSVLGSPGHRHSQYSGAVQVESSVKCDGVRVLSADRV